MSNKKLDTDYVTLELRDGIIIAAYKVKVISLEVAKEVVRTRKEFCQGKSYPSIVLDYGVKSEKDARDYLSSKEAIEGLLAAAMITNSVFKRTMVNFFVKVSRPKLPVKMFSGVEEAQEWLRKWVGE